MKTNGNSKNPSHVESKLCYQTRTGVISTHNKPDFIGNTRENGLHVMENGFVMGYTPIDGDAPTSEERGIASHQKTMGRGGPNAR